MIIILDLLIEIFKNIKINNVKNITILLLIFQHSIHYKEK